MNKTLFSIAAVIIALGGLTNLMAKPTPTVVTDEMTAKITDAAPAKPTKKPKKDRKILIFSLCDGYKHSVIPVADKCFTILGEKTGAYAPTLSTDMSVFTEDNLKQYDAILFNNTTRLKFEDQNHRKALIDFIKSGKGFIGIHAASDNFYNFPEAAEMVGGQFDGHPWTAGGTWAVENIEPEHPINKAFDGKGFKIKDEIYQIKGSYSRDTHRVLLRLDMSDKATGSKEGKRADKDNAISWIKSYGKGRVFYCSFGHNKEVCWNKAVLQHYLDGIQWALGDLKADYTPSNKK